MRKFAIDPSLLAALFLMLALRPPRGPQPPVGLSVKIAIARPCNPNVIPGETVRLLRSGFVQFNSEELTLDELDRRLDTAFRTKVQRVAFLASGADLPFRDVVAVLEVLMRHADYTALVTPQVEDAVMSHAGDCLGPNIRLPQVLF